MKASFDGARRRLSEQFNELCVSGQNYASLEILRAMRTTILGLLCMTDDKCQPEDCNYLGDEIKLKEP